MTQARVHSEHVSGERDVSPWMPESDADELADDMGYQGVYWDVRIEVRDFPA